MASRSSRSALAPGRLLKFAIACLLLPLCYALLVTTFKVTKATLADDLFWVMAIAGAACWFVVYLMLPRPMWIYVLGHELTHVLWTWLFGGRVKKFKATSKGGAVTITKSNFLISLAPYFFPLYAVLVLVGWLIGNWIWDWRALRVFFHLLLGASYAFHLTLTAHVLGSEQSDLAEHGYFFSWVVIFLGNVTIILLALVGLTDCVSVKVLPGWIWTGMTEWTHWFASR